MAMTTGQSASPEVAAWSLILTWPLAVRAKAKVATLRQIRNAVEVRPWRRLERPLHHLREPLAADASPTRDEYAEYLYFYPFIRDFLYDGDGEAMILYRRTDITGATLRFPTAAGIGTVTATVDRVNLYAFRTGDCVLAVEFSLDGAAAQVTEADGSRRPLRLADVLTLNERMRRAYPPYFDGQDAPGFQMDGVAWTGGDESSPMDFATAQDAVATKQTPMADHWCRLLPDLSEEKLEWSQVMDDRIPAMTYVAMADPTAIGDGDWVRLASFDGGRKDGDGAILPYGEAFLAGFQARHCYDRFWDPPGWACRYLCSGSGFVMVEKGNGISFRRPHFHRHYFQMGLLNQFHLAALQSLSHRLSQALSAPDRQTTAPAILSDLMIFTHTYWFPSVSNQVQAKELYDLWRRHLGLEALYSQVSAEANQANALLNRQIDDRAANSAARLNRIGFLGLIGALTTGFLGMNLLVPDQAKGWDNWGAWRDFLKVLAGFGVFFVLGNWALSRWDNKTKE